MNIKSIYILVFLLIFIMFLFGCSAEEAITAEPGRKFTIGVGQSAKVAAEDFTITFNEITGDSRCPRNVTCIWAGEVSAGITVNYQGKENPIILVEPGLTDKAEYEFSGYTFVYHIDPYPMAGEEISPDEYRLTMTITK